MCKRLGHVMNEVDSYNNENTFPLELSKGLYQAAQLCTDVCELFSISEACLVCDLLEEKKKKKLRGDNLVKADTSVNVPVELLNGLKRSSSDHVDVLQMKVTNEQEDEFSWFFDNDIDIVGAGDGEIHHDSSVDEEGLAGS
jgi:hypothetical protein